MPSYNRLTLAIDQRDRTSIHPCKQQQKNLKIHWVLMVAIKGADVQPSF